MKWLVFILWGLSLVGGLAAFILETSFAPWFVAFVTCAGWMRIEMLHEKMDKFVVIEDADEV